MFKVYSCGFFEGVAAPFCMFDVSKSDFVRKTALAASGREYKQQYCYVVDRSTSEDLRDLEIVYEGEISCVGDVGYGSYCVYKTNGGIGKTVDILLDEDGYFDAIARSYPHGFCVTDLCGLYGPFGSIEAASSWMRSEERYEISNGQRSAK